MPTDSGDQRALIARLRAVIGAKDAENALLRAELETAVGAVPRLELRVAELERRIGSDSTNSGIPPSKDPIGARERRKAGRTKQRQSSERERRKDRKRGGQPGHPGAGLARDPDPDERTEVPPPAGCSRCGTGLAGAERTGTWWSQVRDVKITRFVSEYLLPLLACPCCGKVNAARGPGQSCPGSVSCGPGINTAAVLLSCYGNVPSERAANLIGMLVGMPVSAGFVDLASERLSTRLQDAGFDDAMQTALRKEPVLEEALPRFRREPRTYSSRRHHPSPQRKPLAPRTNPLNQSSKPRLAGALLAGTYPAKARLRVKGRPLGQGWRQPRENRLVSPTASAHTPGSPAARDRAIPRQTNGGTGNAAAYSD
jgi:hypothetical protein